MEKVIGVIGGMGPEATLNLYQKIIESTPASCDQEHLRVIIDSNPKVPDRTAAILAGRESPLPLLVAAAEALKRAGAHFVIMPCVSAHFFQEELRSRISLPLLSLFDVTADFIRQTHPQVRRVGLLATTGTIQGGRFAERLERAGLETIHPGTAYQERLMAAIYAVKGTAGNQARERVREDVRQIAESLVSDGAQGIIGGCTEIPLVLRSEDLSVPFFDTLLLLARAAIQAAGREPVPIPQEA